MKRILLLCFAILGLVFRLKAQVYGNEWIDYSKTYYKFELAQSGIYRIPQSLLVQYGLGNIPADQFQLWHDGQQVTLYASSGSGIPAAGDYLEFYGTRNDGSFDTQLYQPGQQLCSHYSLFTDSSAYFLTVDSGGINQRYLATPNNTANPPAPLPYFTYTTGVYPENSVNLGSAVLVDGVYIYESSFDEGEGLTSLPIGGGASYSAPLSNLYAFGGGPTPTLKVALAGDAPNNRNIRISWDGQTLQDTLVQQFGAQSFLLQVPVLNATNTATVLNESTDPNDRIVVASVELTYPRQFNFAGAGIFRFSLGADPQPEFLQIANFNNSGGSPVLYDLSNNLRLVGDLSNPGYVQFLLPASAVPRTLVLVNENLPEEVQEVSDLQSRNFINYSDPAQQGNFLIITTPEFLNDGNGNNPAQQYANYRSSPQGGGFQARICMMDQLEDQFAYGISSDPLSIRNFARFAYDHFGLKPGYIFLVGSAMTYDQYRFNQSLALVRDQEQVPTFGSPASDNLLTAFGPDITPMIPIGRLSAINATELENYLQKVEQYERIQQDTNPSDQNFGTLGWQKNVLDIVGANQSLAALLSFYFNGYDALLEDTSYGANPVMVTKTSLDPVQQASGYVDTLFAHGLGFVNYFGHSAAVTLGFSLDDPSQFNNSGKYPIFMANGCNAGDNFILDSLRFQGPRTFSEHNTLAPDAGSIIVLASTSFGITNILNSFITLLYQQIGQLNFGASLGSSLVRVIQKQVATQNGNFLVYANAEQFDLNGDPAVKTFGPRLPDFDIESSKIQFSPAQVTVSQGTFNLSFVVFNIGRAVRDSLEVQVKRILPDGSTQLLMDQNIEAPAFSDSFQIRVPVNPIKDAGSNRFLITLDPSGLLSELTRSNNQAEADLVIYSNDAKPVYPYEFSIQTNSAFPFYASSANPFAPVRTYSFELDTTQDFNSPLKLSQAISQAGGLIRFNPMFNLIPNTVYYWRVGVLQPAQATIWNNSSFLYQPGGAPGWNQSHYFQYLSDQYQNLNLDSGRDWVFNPINFQVSVNTVVYPTDANNQEILVNSGLITQNSCGSDLSSLQFVVFNPGNMRPLANQTINGSGLYNSQPVCTSNAGSTFEFNFKFDNLAGREHGIAFFDSIPDNSLVSLTFWISNTYLANQTFIKDWQADSSILGSGHTLYDKLKGLGFTMIDSFYHNVPMMFLFRKNADGSFTPVYQAAGTNAGQELTYNFTVRGLLDSGTIQTPVLGPALGWTGLHWRGQSLEATPGDTTQILVYGIDTAGNSRLLYVDTARDTSLSFINASLYPNLQLQLDSRDQIHNTPVQLDELRVNYQPVPEGAVAPNLYFAFPDTVDIGQPLVFSLAFANISPNAFDSMKVNIVVTDQNNIPHILPVNRLRKLLAQDTLHITYSLDTRTLSGLNTLFVDINPGGDQPEQYHFNNFIYKQFYVRPDNLNPLLDITFDGTHILNDDIVSSRPHVLIRLQDQNKYLALADTSLIQVNVQYPDGSVHPYYFSSDTLRFTPAVLSGANPDNTARVDFFPSFTQDGTYELQVTGRSQSNKALVVSYLVGFEVINKPMISHLMNYPNPFTTSTAFVFTLTGSQIPSQIKIEIMTITGKVVREITKEELGPLHIGRNITTYHWDGRDQYGQKLANGIYLYRVVASLEGNSLDIFKSGADPYITHGYGKMYLMR